MSTKLHQDRYAKMRRRYRDEGLNEAFAASLTSNSGSISTAVTATVSQDVD